MITLDLEKLDWKEEPFEDGILYRIQISTRVGGQKIIDGSDIRIRGRTETKVFYVRIPTEYFYVHRDKRKSVECNGFLKNWNEVGKTDKYYCIDLVP